MRAFLSIILVLFLVACSGVDKPSKPKNLIPKDKMVHVLIDVSLLSSARGVNKNKLEKEGFTTENYIYKKHNIDSIQFAESSAYYAYDTKVNTDIYKRVEDSLNKLKEFYDKKLEDERRIKTKKKDSLVTPRPVLKDIKIESKQEDDEVEYF